MNIGDQGTSKQPMAYTKLADDGIFRCHPLQSQVPSRSSYPGLLRVRDDRSTMRLMPNNANRNLKLAATLITAAACMGALAIILAASTPDSRPSGETTPGLTSTATPRPASFPIAENRSFDAILPQPELGPDDTVFVRVRGKKFVWRFQYVGNDGVWDSADDLHTNQLHLPLAHEINLELTSDDYIYTFSMPQLNLEEIAVPELTHRLKFQATQSGRFELLADPLCGLRLFHDEVMGRAVIEPRAGFLKWFAVTQSMPAVRAY